MSATPIPDDERLFRLCDGNKVKASGAVHWRAFYATNLPYELSVDRESQLDCPPAEHARRQGRGACAAVPAKAARAAGCDVIHVPDGERRPSYSQIIVPCDGEPPRHKSFMSASQMATLRAIVKELAQASRGERVAD